MPRPAVKIKKILDGKVSLYVKPRETIWQYGFILNKEHIRKTTKTEDFAEACSYATEAYIDARALAKSGYSVVTRSFKSVAEVAIKSMEDSLAKGMGKVIFENYIAIIKKYLIPFFGRKNIDNIDYEALSAFGQWRRIQMKCNPSRTTVGTHNSALSRVFDAALARSYITASQVPELKNDGEQTQRRPSFSNDDFIKLREFMDVWVTQGKKGKITHKREILRDYVMFISKTGVRPGTETQGLKWKNIRYEMQGRVPLIHITVSGKRKERSLIADHSIIRSLTRLLHRQTKYANMAIGDAIEQKLDAYVFALPDGEEVKNLIRPFAILLEQGNLLTDTSSMSDEPRTLYSLRHFYITRKIRNGFTSAQLATQCGTSMAMIDQFYFHKDPMVGARGMASGMPDLC